jgi:hypothetical protein
MDNNDKLLQDVTKNSHVSASNTLKMGSTHTSYNFDHGKGSNTPLSIHDLTVLTIVTVLR